MTTKKQMRRVLVRRVKRAFRAYIAAYVQEATKRPVGLMYAIAEGDVHQDAWRELVEFDRARGATELPTSGWGGY